jgi:hypothetical protein
MILKYDGGGVGKDGSGTITVDGTKSGESEFQKRKLGYFLSMIFRTWEPMVEPSG